MMSMAIMAETRSEFCKSSFISITKLRSILTIETGIFFNLDKDENPIPKSSSAKLNP